MSDPRKTAPHKERLLRSGWDLFYLNGFHGTTVDSILAASGVPKGSFYHHFGSKEMFARAVLERYDEYQHEVLQGWSDREDLTVPGRIVGYHTDLIARFVASDWQRACLVGKLSSELSPHSDEFRGVLAASLHRWRSGIAELLHDGQQRGEIRDDESATNLADVFLAMVQGAFVAALVVRDRDYLDATTRSLSDFLQRAVIGPGLTWKPKRRNRSRVRPPVVASTHRDRLLQAGIELFFEYGYHGTTVDQLLVTAHVPKGSFYHHFGSKEAFACAVLDYYSGFHNARLQAWSDKHDLTTPEQLYGYVTELAQIFVDSGYRNCDLAGKLATEVAATSEVLRSKIDESVEQWRVHLESLLSAGQSRGDIRTDCETSELSASIHALLDGAFIVGASTREIGAIGTVASAIMRIVSTD